ncbi:MAG: DUF350 domain-containing protein [Planctomycetaceae bacterium]
MLIGTINEVAAQLAHGLVLTATALVLLTVARAVFGRTTRLDPTTELIQHTNRAYGLYLAAFLAGTAIALAGTLFGRQAEPLDTALLAMACEGLLLIVLMDLGCTINDRLVLTGFSLDTEISSDRNQGAAFCVGGSCLATGLVLNGALSGYSNSLLLGLRDTLILWAIGQLVLIIGAVLYRRLASFDIHQLIQYDNNAAAGLRFGSFLAGLGLVVRGALLRAPMTEASHALDTLALAGGGLVAFALLYPLVRRLALLTRSSNDEVDMQGNMSVSLIDAAVTLGLALLISQAIARSLQGVPIDAP